MSTMAWHVDAAALERYAESHACARAASYASRPSLLSQYAMAQIAQCATSRDAHMH